MSLYAKLTRQYLRSRTVLAIAMTGGMLGLASVHVLSRLTHRGYGKFTRDLASICGVSPLTGFLSQAGLLLWAAAAGVCLLGARLAATRSVNLETSRFLATSGILTAVLCLDDTFQIHEEILPHFGVPEISVLSAHAIFALLFVARFRTEIARTDYMLLLIAFAFFAASLTVDLTHPAWLGQFWEEDAMRFLGIVFWLAYFYRVGVHRLDCRVTATGI